MAAGQNWTVQHSHIKHNKLKLQHRETPATQIYRSWSIWREINADAIILNTEIFKDVYLLLKTQSQKYQR